MTTESRDAWEKYFKDCASQIDGGSQDINKFIMVFSVQGIVEYQKDLKDAINKRDMDKLGGSSIPKWWSDEIIDLIDSQISQL